MFFHGKLFLHTLECYFGVYFPSCALFSLFLSTYDIISHLNNFRVRYLHFLSLLNRAMSHVVEIRPHKRKESDPFVLKSVCHKTTLGRFHVVYRYWLWITYASLNSFSFAQPMRFYEYDLLNRAFLCYTIQWRPAMFAKGHQSED